MKFQVLALAALVVSALALTACSTGNNAAATSGGVGVLYIVAQGNTSISAYSVNLSSGTLGTVGNTLATGLVPSALAITPAINALYVANTGGNNLSSYTINSDGSLTAISGTTATGASPQGMATDPAGKFLLVTNQGTFQNPKSGTISVFSIQGTTLKSVTGSPFATEMLGELTGGGRFPWWSAHLGSMFTPPISSTTRWRLLP